MSLQSNKKEKLWGKVISTTGTLATTLGADQPFRYRGYVYDTETGWYYLQSRYYNPETCRFISADVLLSTGQGVLGHNSFAYCLNNPVNRVDPSGYSSFWDNLKNALTVVAVVAIAVAAVALTAVAVIGTGGMALALVGGGVAASAATAATVATAAVATGAVAAAGVAAVNIGQNIAYSNNISQRNGTPRNNQAQNKQFRDAMREAGIKDKNIMRQIHNEISKLDFSYQEIVEYALEFVKHP